MTVQVLTLKSQREDCCSYVLIDERTGCAAVVNPLEDTLAGVEAAVSGGQLKLEWVLATHASAGAVATASELAAQHLCAVSAGPDSGYEREVQHNERLQIGHRSLRCWRSGANASYVVEGTVFSGCRDTASATLAPRDELHELSDDMVVLLHHALPSSAQHRATLADIR